MQQEPIAHKITRGCLFCRREKISRVENLNEWVRNGPYHECECKSTPPMTAITKMEIFYEEAAAAMPTTLLLDFLGVDFAVLVVIMGRGLCCRFAI